MTLYIEGSRRLTSGSGQPFDHQEVVYDQSRLRAGETISLPWPDVYLRVIELSQSKAELQISLRDVKERVALEIGDAKTLQIESGPLAVKLALSLKE